MQITFCGAAGTVTGSCYLVETKQTRFLVDCGMFQGNKELRDLNQRDFLFNPAALDFVLLTHAHVDHAGLLPHLYKSGFQKQIYATKASTDLCGIILPDSGHIQEMEVEWRNRKRARKGEALQKPLYTAADALETLKLFQSLNYLEEFKPVPEVKVRFNDAGHILGSSIIEVWITEDGKETKIVFSGDLGQVAQPIIQDPTWINDADYLLVESTYGDRLHEDSAEKIALLREMIIQSVKSGGNLVIPAFAVGRTQDLLYHIRELLNLGAIPSVPVYIDSPMAVSVTEIYRNNPNCYDQETKQMFANHQSPFEFPNLHFIRTAEESKKLNELAKGAIVISASGMCEAGRILHHLKHNLWRPESNVLFVGYQAEGTLGRRLLEGAKVVKIMGEEIAVKAKINSIGGFSAHADQNGLLDWLRHFATKPRNLFLVHGEQSAQDTLAQLIQEKLGWSTIIPKLGESFALAQTAELKKNLAPPVKTSVTIARTLTDLEHVVLDLRQQLNQVGITSETKSLVEAHRLVSELERLVKKPS